MSVCSLYLGRGLRLIWVSERFRYSSFPVAKIQSPDKATSERKGLFWSQCPVRAPSGQENDRDRSLGELVRVHLQSRTSKECCNVDVQLAFIYAVPAPTQRIVLPRVKMDLLTSINISRTILLFTGMARDFVFWVMLNAVRLAINTNCLWYHFLDVWSGFK